MKTIIFLILFGIFCGAMYWMFTIDMVPIFVTVILFILIAWIIIKVLMGAKIDGGF